MNNFAEYDGEKTSITNGVLDLSWKKIKNFSHIKGLARSTPLRELILRENDLISIPETIGKLDSLQILNIGGNQLSVLPISIGKLELLKKLNLEYNQLTTLPESIIALERRGVTIYKK